MLTSAPTSKAGRNRKPLRSADEGRLYCFAGAKYDDTCEGQHEDSSGHRHRRQFHTIARKSDPLCVIRMLSLATAASVTLLRPVELAGLSLPGDN